MPQEGGKKRRWIHNNSGNLQTGMDPPQQLTEKFVSTECQSFHGMSNGVLLFLSEDFWKVAVEFAKRNSLPQEGERMMGPQKLRTLAASSTSCRLEGQELFHRTIDYWPHARAVASPEKEKVSRRMPHSRSSSLKSQTCPPPPQTPASASFTSMPEQ